MEEQIATRFALYRGGTSKAVFVRREDVPMLSGSALEAWILAIFGSPDRRQIDGLGGADPLTSKFAIIGPPSRADADVDYTFYQVGIDEARVFSDLNCGNISAAVGPYAIDEKLVPATAPWTTVRIHATNFNKIILARVEVCNQKAKVTGAQRIHGVPGSGSPIFLDLCGMAGAHTGRLLPTGRVRDSVSVAGVGDVEMSIIDMANVVCFVEAKQFGLQGSEDPVDLMGRADLMDALTKTRLAVAVKLGLVRDMASALARPPAIPWISLVSSPGEWIDHATGGRHAADECDFSARLFSRGRVLKTYPGTGSACTGVAALIKGSVVNSVMRQGSTEGDTVRIGHPCGSIDVSVTLRALADGSYDVEQAAFIRTARRLADGRLYVAAG